MTGQSRFAGEIHKMDVVGFMGSELPRLKEGGDLVLTVRSEAPLKVHHTLIWIFVSLSRPCEVYHLRLPPQLNRASPCVRSSSTRLWL